MCTAPPHTAPCPAASSLARRPVKLEHETAAEFELLSAGGGAAAQHTKKEAKQEDEMRGPGDGSDSDEFAEFKCACCSAQRALQTEQ